MPKHKPHSNQTSPVKPVAPAAGFLFGGNKAWHSKPYAHASQPSVPKQSMILINLNQDGDTDAAVDLGDANAMRYLSVTSTLAKYASASPKALSLITLSTSPAAAQTMTTIYKRFAQTVIRQKPTPRAKHIRAGGSHFIFCATPTDTTPPPTRKKN